MEFRADLHCHSNCSDGSDSPPDLLKLAKELSLSGLSITDHDTLRAYTPSLFAKAKELNIRLLTGLEISSELEKTPVHILGYGVELSLQEFLAKVQTARAGRNGLILQKLKIKGMPITQEELNEIAPNRTIGRPHIAALLVKKGYVSSIQEAFERYLKEGAPCYAGSFKAGPLEVIDAIHAAKGKAVLAHPHFFKKRALLDKLLKLPFDGLECYYARFPKQVADAWVIVAQKHGLIASGGSDYHGAFKPQTPLGSSWVNEETFSLLAK